VLSYLSYCVRKWSAHFLFLFGKLNDMFTVQVWVTDVACLWVDWNQSISQSKWAICDFQWWGWSSDGDKSVIVTVARTLQLCLTETIENMQITYKLMVYFCCVAVPESQWFVKSLWIRSDSQHFTGEFRRSLPVTNTAVGLSCLCCTQTRWRCWAASSSWSWSHSWWGVAEMAASRRYSHWNNMLYWIWQPRRLDYNRHQNIHNKQ